MEKIKALFDAVISYCTNVPFHAVTVIGLTVFILAIVAALVVLTVKNKRKNTPESQSETTEGSTNEIHLSETVETENADERPPQKDEITKVQPAPTLIEEDIFEAEMPEGKILEEEVSEKKIPEKIPSEAETKTFKEVSEITEQEIPKVTGTQISKIPEETQETETEEREEAVPIPEIKTQVRRIKKSDLKKEKTVAAKPVDGEKKETNNTPIYKEGTMLHDELKDINTELDFYEEDETDKVARYSGKWVICRVVTNDSENEDMYFFELHASNGEKLLSSEEYTNYNGAVRGIETHKSNILRGNFRISLSKKGDYTYKLLNGKGMLLCMGEHYETKADCERVIELAKRFARTAFVDENIQDVVVKVPTESDADITALPEGHNGKWIIDCRVSPEGERVFFFELLANDDECLLSSEEYSSYIGAINGIQTHKVNIKNGNFRVFLTKQGDYIYKLLNGNGQLLCLGEHYKTKRRCENAVELVKRFAMNSPILTDPELTKE